MLPRAEKMDVESPVALGGVVAAVCIVDDDPSMLKALECLLASLDVRVDLLRAVGQGQELEARTNLGFCGGWTVA